MATTVSELNVKLSTDTSSMSAGLSRGVGSLRGFTSAADRAGSSIAQFESVATRAANGGGGGVSSLAGGLVSVVSALAGVTAAASAAGVAMGAIGLAKGLVLGSQFETAGVQLKALTGSGVAATAMLSDLRRFSASSPFELPELVDASKRLLAVGVSAGGVVPLLQEVGNVAAGVGAPVGQIADQFTRVAAEGSLGSRELREFGRQGIPIVQALAQRFHTTAAGVEQLASAGRLGFTDLKTAFDQMTASGGRFNGILDAQAATLGGRYHALSTDLGGTFADVSMRLADAFHVPAGLGAIDAAVRRVDAVARLSGAQVKTVISDVAQFGAGVASQFAANLGREFASLPDIIAGRAKAGDLWTPLTTGLDGVRKELDAMTRPTTATVDVKPLLDPSAMTLSITPEVKRAKAIVSGSADAMAARFASRYPIGVAGSVPPPAAAGVAAAVPPPPAVSLAGAGPAPLSPAVRAAAGHRTSAAAAVAAPPTIAAAVAPTIAATPPPPLAAPDSAAAAPPSVGLTPAASATLAVRQAQAAWQAAAARARASDGTGGRQHAADQAAARVALQQLRDAQRQREAVKVRPPTPSAIAPPPAVPPSVAHGTPLPGVAHAADGTGTVADYLRAHPDARLESLPPLARARTPTYGAAGRAELSDARPLPDGRYAVRSSTTGMAGVVDQAAVDRMRREALRSHASDPGRTPQLGAAAQAYAASQAATQQYMRTPTVENKAAADSLHRQFRDKADPLPEQYRAAAYAGQLAVPPPGPEQSDPRAVARLLNGPSAWAANATNAVARAAIGTRIHTPAGRIDLGNVAGSVADVARAGLMGNLARLRSPAPADPARQRTADTYARYQSAIAAAQATNDQGPSAAAAQANVRSALREYQEAQRGSGSTAAALAPPPVVPARPPTAVIPGAAVMDAGGGGSRATGGRSEEQVRQGTDFLRRIEQNTRPIAASAVQTVSI